MEAKGESYRTLEGAGFSQRTVWRVIKQIETAKMETLCRFADHFGVCVSDLYDDGCGWEV